MASGRREQRLRILAEVFDSLELEEVQREQRERLGDCWDCRREHRCSYVWVGGVLHMVLDCAYRGRGSLDGPVMVKLPYRCGSWLKRDRLRVVEGGLGDTGEK
jgi:hypothetical protein